MSALPTRSAESSGLARRARLLLNDNLLTAAAVIQLGAGVVTSKLAATMLGATGVGIYALVQGVANIVALCALGSGEALVREWGRRRSRGSDQPIDRSPEEAKAEFGAMLRGAELAALAALAVVAIASLLFNGPLARLLFGSRDVDRELFLLAVAAGITFGWVTLQVNSLVAQREVRRVSVALALAAASTPAVALVGFQAWGVEGIGRVHLMAMLASLLTTGAVVWGRTASLTTSSSLRAGLSEVPGLLRYGVPHVLGTLFTASMLLIVPLVVAARQGVDAAGFYRAAAAIAAGMATLFTFELNGDFSARVAEDARDWGRFTNTVTAQARRLLVRGIAVVCVLSVAAPIVVPLLYDRGFEPTTRLLPLILVGQLLGLLAMTVNIGIGARHGGGALLLNAAIGGGATVAAVAVADSLAGVGVAFVGGQLVFLGTCGLSIPARNQLRSKRRRRSQRSAATADG